jgi:hypothetical protein
VNKASGGERFSPSHVYRSGMSPPGTHAVVANPKTSSCWGVVVETVPAESCFRGGAVWPGGGSRSSRPLDPHAASAITPTTASTGNSERGRDIDAAG